MEESIWGMQNSKSGEGTGSLDWLHLACPSVSTVEWRPSESSAAVMGEFDEECSYTHSVPTCCWTPWQVAFKVPGILKYFNFLLKILNFFLTFSSPSLSFFVPKVFCIFCGTGVDDLISLLIIAWFKAKAFQDLLFEKFIYFWLCWVFLAALRLLLAVVRGLLPRCSVRASPCSGFSRCRAGVRGLSCPTACGIFPEQDLKLCSLHWRVDS